MYENQYYNVKPSEQFYEQSVNVAPPQTTDTVSITTTGVLSPNTSNISNSNVTTQYPNNYANYYDPQYNAYASSGYNAYAYTPYYANSFNNGYQYQDKFYNANSNFQQFSSDPQSQAKPASPGPNSQYANINSGTDLTPEKQNDSGIDVISPQLASVSANNVYESHSYTQLQQQNQVYMTPKVEETRVLAPPTSSITSSITETTDESIDDDEDSDSDDESDEFESSKENLNEKCSEISSKASGKSKNGGSSSLSNQKSGTPTKPPKPYLEIIADAVLSSKVKMMQLHEIYHYMENKYEYFFKNVNKSWRNSVRHNLSLNECFVKAGRGSNGKGNYWKIHPLCEKEFIRGCFRRKSFKQLIRAGSAQANHHNHHHASHLTYSLPVDYALNFRTMVPPPLPQQFLTSSSASNLSSFQYPVFTHEQMQQQQQPLQQQPQNHSYAYSNVSKSSQQGNDASSSSITKGNATGFHPYRI